jgi:hypothetical protein
VRPNRSFAAISCAIALLAWASAARAGGVPVQLALSGHRLWTVSDAGVIELDARNGRVLARPQVGASYPLRVAIGAGAAWVAAVENGYAAGALTRIDLSNGRVTTRLREPRGPVFEVAAGGGSVWALTGPTRAASVLRVEPRTGRRIGVVRGPTRPSWIAAGRSGLWIVGADGSFLHARQRASRATTVLRLRGLGEPAVGAGSVWIPHGHDLLRVDARTGGVRARIRLGARPATLAVGGSAVWGVTYTRAGRAWLVRVSTRTNTVTAKARVPIGASSLAATGRRVLVGVSGARRRVLELDGRTRARRLLALLQ